ncbi:MAG: hypothetical protein WAK57_11610 [Desulfobacterales bacterium]
MAGGTKITNNGIKRTECTGMVQNKQYFHMIRGLSWGKCKERGQATPGPPTTPEKHFKHPTAGGTCVTFLQVGGFLHSKLFFIT